MNINVSTVTHSDGSIHVYFNGIEAWDDYDLIISILQQENNCKILSNQEMIYMRRGELELDEIIFELRYDDMLGNFLYTNDKRIIPFMEQLAKSVIESIKQKLRTKGIKEWM